MADIAKHHENTNQSNNPTRPYRATGNSQLSPNMSGPYVQKQRKVNLEKWPPFALRFRPRPYAPPQTTPTATNAPAGRSAARRQSRPK
jgi:hypothetical protein